MSEERIIYGFCGANCREPVYSRDEIMSILQQAIEAGSLQGIDITKSPLVKIIRETRADANLSFWMGTEAQFNAISPAVSASIVIARIDADGNIYLCTDDTTFSSWQAETLELLEAQQAEALNAFQENVNTAIANKQNKHTKATVSLTVAGWSSNAQTVSVTGVTASNTVFVAPAPASHDNYGAAGIRCTAQAAGTLTFTCTKTPTEAISVNVVILEV